MKLRQWLNQLAERFLSDRLVRAARLRRRVRADGKLQKLWLDRSHRELLASPLEAEFFRKYGLTAFIHHCQDDYRCAVDVRKEFLCLAPDSTHTGADERTLRTQLAFAAKSWSPEDTLTITVDGHDLVYRDLRFDRWTDLRLPFSRRGLKIRTTRPVVMTMPRVVQIAPKSANSLQPAENVSARHVVILVLDSWSSQYVDGKHPFKFDSTSPTGRAKAMPNFERFFGQGLMAKNGFSSGEWTLPAVSSLFTGLYPGKHRLVHPRRWTEFPRDQRTLPEYLQHQGFHTLLGSCVTRITPAFGHLRGIDRFLYHFPKFSEETYHPAKWADELTGHLQAHRYDRTFSYLHFPDPHPIWDNPEESREFSLGRTGGGSWDLRKFLRAKRSASVLRAPCEEMYLLKLAEIDRQLGGLLNFIETELGDEALVIATSDHGLRMPYEEEYTVGEPYLKDVRVQIPLYVRGRGVDAVKYEALCLPNLDIPRIISEATGIKWDREMDGVNITKPHGPRPVVINESFFRGVYEIAARANEFTAILKFDLDDTTNLLKTDRPHYSCLFKRGETDFSCRDGVSPTDLKTQHPETMAQLSQIAREHIRSVGLLAGLDSVSVSGSAPPQRLETTSTRPQQLRPEVGPSAQP